MSAACQHARVADGAVECVTGQESGEPLCAGEKLVD